MKESVQRLLNRPLKSKEIGERAGVTRQSIDKYRSGVSELDNITYGNIVKLKQAEDLYLVEEWEKRIPNLRLAVKQFNEHEGEASFFYNSQHHIVWVETELNETIVYPNEILTLAKKTKETKGKYIPTAILSDIEIATVIDQFNRYKDCYPKDTWHLIDWRYNAVVNTSK